MAGEKDPDLISLQESCSLFKISETTIKRFIEAGYLSVQEKRVEGLSDDELKESVQLLRLSELYSIFSDDTGIPHQQVSPYQAVNTSNSAIKPEDTDEEGERVSVQQPHIRGSREGKKRSLLEVNEHFCPTDNKVDGVTERLRERKGTAHSLSDDIYIETDQINADYPDDGFQIDGSSKPDRIVDENSQALVESKTMLNPIRLNNIIGLQEKILTEKEKEIEDLKKQRDWLQGRIEKLEQHSEQDKAILYTNTQTLRSLIDTQKKSKFKGLLNLIGFSPREKQ
jgi:hypothetical protein